MRTQLLTFAAPLLFTSMFACGPDVDYVPQDTPSTSEGERVSVTLSIGATTPSTSTAWTFDTDGDREGWSLANADDFLGGPTGGGWIFLVPGADPTLTSPALSIDAAAHSTLSVRLANDGNPAEGSQLQVFWAGPGQGFAEERSAVAAVSNSGGWATYTLDLAASPQWTGTIERLRVDPVRFGSGGGVGVDFIALDDVAPSTDPPEDDGGTTDPVPPTASGALDWQFNSDGYREGWTTTHVTELTDGPAAGSWVFLVPGADPQLMSPTFSHVASAADTLTIRMANDGNPLDGSELQVFWAGPGQGFAEARSALMPVGNTGGWETYTLHLGGLPEWSGEINQLRIDPIRHGSGHGVGVDFISVGDGGTSTPPETDPGTDPGTTDPPPTDAGPAPASTGLTLSGQYFRADATTSRGVSAWGTESYPLGQPGNARSLVFWGRFNGGACASPGYGTNVEHPYGHAGLSIYRAAFPDCGGAYGPSVEADAYAFGAPQHLVRTEVSPSGTFQDFGAQGQNATGANPYIEAAYVEFNPDWQTASRFRPFSGPSADPALIRMALRAQQSVLEARLDDPNNQQLQQVIRMVLINDACDIASSSSFCQIELNFKTYIRGVGAYTSFGAGNAFNDGGQGGLIAVVGPINSTGASTTINGDAAWTSWGAPTQQAPFSDQTFQVEITWNQFQRLLTNVANNNPAGVFGPNWQSRDNWVLLRIGYGQENYNRSTTTTSAIDGLFESIEIFAL